MAGTRLKFWLLQERSDCSLDEHSFEISVREN